MSTVEALRALFDEILREAAGNPRFGTRVADVLSEAVKSSPATEKPRRRGRRAPGALDPLEVYSEGEAELRRRLEKLDIEQRARSRRSLETLAKGQAKYRRRQ